MIIQDNSNVRVLSQREVSKQIDAAVYFADEMKVYKTANKIVSGVSLGLAGMFTYFCADGFFEDNAIATSFHGLMAYSALSSSMKTLREAFSKSHEIEQLSELVQKEKMFNPYSNRIDDFYIDVPCVVVE